MQTACTDKHFPQSNSSLFDFTKDSDASFFQVFEQNSATRLKFDATDRSNQFFLFFFKKGKENYEASRYCVPFSHSSAKSNEFRDFHVHVRFFSVVIKPSFVTYGAVMNFILYHAFIATPLKKETR